MIEKKLEDLFRKCINEFNSMAIANVYESKILENYLQIVVESTENDEMFIEDLFWLGKMYGELK